MYLLIVLFIFFGFLIFYDKFDSRILSLRLQSYLRLYNHRNIKFYLIRYWGWKFSSSFKSPSSFVHILLFIVIVYLTIFSFNFFDSFIKPINQDIAFKLLDSRINGLATLFSVSIAVIFFILNSFRDKGEEQYFIAFRASNMYPTLYFILITILFISATVYYIFYFFPKDENYKYLDFTKLVIMSYLLIFLILLMIGYILLKIYKITHDNILIREYTKYMKQLQFGVDISNFQNIISYNIYNEFREEVVSNNFYTLNNHSNYIPITIQVNAILYNINLLKLRKIILKIRDLGFNVYLRELSLNQSFRQGEYLYYIHKDVNMKIKKTVFKCFKFQNV